MTCVRIDIPGQQLCSWNMKFACQISYMAMTQYVRQIPGVAHGLHAFELHKHWGPGDECQPCQSNHCAELMLDMLLLVMNIYSLKFESARCLTTSLIQSVKCAETNLMPTRANAGQISTKADMYSFGVVLWELVTAETPRFGQQWYRPPRSGSLPDDAIAWHDLLLTCRQHI